MGIIKETDNITLNVYWKGWKKSTQRADYISKIRNIINRIDSSAQTSSQIDGCTFIKMELPHMELETYKDMNDNEHEYNYQNVDFLLGELEKDNDVSSVQLEINDLEKGGRNYYIDHPYCKVIKYKGDFPSIVQLYPL